MRRNMALGQHSLRLNRRTLSVISALGVAAVVLMAGLAYYLDVHRYPSENTPLVLQSWGVTLVRKQPEEDYGASPPPFANISLTWSRGYDYGAYGSPLLSMVKQFNASGFSLPEDIESYYSMGITGWFSDDLIDGVRVIGSYGIFITDHDGDGLFDYGDAVSLVASVYEDGVLTHQGFYPNTVYMIALGPYNASYSAGHYDPWQFKYAIHHERLYAWEYHWHFI